MANPTRALRSPLYGFKRFCYAQQQRIRALPLRPSSFSDEWEAAFWATLSPTEIRREIREHFTLEKRG